MFDTVELLEQILMKLPIEDAIRLRQVNSSWNDTVIVSASSDMKHRLFLSPGPPTELWGYSIIRAAIVQYNPRYPFECPTGCMRSILNTAVFERKKWNSAPVDHMILGETIDFKRIPNLGHDRSIFGNMLLCQPPATTVEFKICYRISGTFKANDPQDAGFVKGEINEDSGVRVRDVLEVVSKNMPAADIHGEYVLDIVRSDLCPKRVVFEEIEVSTEHYASRRIQDAIDAEQEYNERMWSGVDLSTWKGFTPLSLPRLNPWLHS